MSLTGCGVCPKTNLKWARIKGALLSRIRISGIAPTPFDGPIKGSSRVKKNLLTPNATGRGIPDHRTQQKVRLSIVARLLARFLVVATLTSCRNDPPEASSGSSSRNTTDNNLDRELPLTSDSSTPAIVASQADPALLTPDGWGPLRIGMSKAEVVLAAGGDSNPAAVGGPDPERCDEFHPSKAPAGILVMVESGVLTRISVSRNSEIRTPEGLRVGASAARVLEVYGPRARVDPHKYWPDPAKYITAWREAPPETDRRGIRFEVDSAGAVVHMRAGTRSIEYVEGCL
jgi:hypothetical protein